MKKSGLKTALWILLLFLADRISKMYFLSRFRPGESVPVIGDLLRFTLVFNKGAAFGSLQKGGWVLAAFSAVILGVIFFLLASGRVKDRLSFASLVLIAGGAVGNLFDRMKYGYVVDFIDADIPDIFPSLPRWYVFNFADSFISIGMTLIVIHILFSKEGSHAPGTA